MAPLAALMALLAAALGPGGPAPLRVVSDVAACPSPTEVHSALRQALGEGNSSTGGWTLWYGRDPAALAAEREASLLMELVDAKGEHLTTRRIPTPPGDCAAIGTAMAAVVERSLRDLGWTRGDALPESAETAKPIQTVRGPAQAPRTMTPIPRLVVGAGPLLATTARLGTNLSLEARVRVVGPLCLQMRAAALAGSDSESLASGKVSLKSRTFSLAALAAHFVKWVELSGGPVVWLAVDQASSTDLPRVGSGTRVVVAVGAGMGVAVPLGKRWRVGVGLAGTRLAFAPETFVDLNGIRTTVLAPSPWQGMAVAKLEFVPWP